MNYAEKAMDDYLADKHEAEEQYRVDRAPALAAYQASVDKATEKYLSALKAGEQANVQTNKARQGRETAGTVQTPSATPNAPETDSGPILGHSGKEAKA